MNRTFDPELLTAFLAIADTGSFTEAARRTNRTQSAVSMQIKRLEELVGRELFHREGRSVRLTAEGELLVGHARRILKAHQEAAAVFSESALEGTVVLGTPDEYAVSFLPGILCRFAETHPLVHVDVICDTTQNLRARLAEGAIDVAMVTHGHGGDDDGIILLREPLVWATSAHHCAAEQDPVPLALFHPGCRFRQWAIEALTREGRAFRIAYTSVSLAGIEAATRAGLAVCAEPRSNVRDGLRILTEADGFPPLPHYQVALLRAEGAGSPVAEALADHIIESFRPWRAGAAVA